jgi:hypothetical protein
MNMDITGKYTINIPIQTMFINTSCKVHGENIITLLGESFFMNRCINDEFNPIKYIALGAANSIPRKSDAHLGAESARRICVCIADINLKQIRLNAKFDAKEIIGTSEIGVFNDRFMISHDKFNKIDDSFLNISGEVDIEYVFQFTTGALKGGWKESTQAHVFYIPEPNNVIGVCEKASNYWYRPATNLNQLNTTRGLYYYDKPSRNLYIRPKNDVTLAGLENKEIVVQVK